MSLSDLSIVAHVSSRLRVELVVLRRLLDEAAAGLGQAVEPRGVGVLGGGLLRDLAAVLGPVEVLGRQGAQFLVRLVELLLALVGFLGDFQPLAELLGQPERVVGLVEHVEHEARRAGVRPARQVIVRPRADFQRLRGDALARRAEGRLGGQFLLFRRADRGDLLAADRRLAVGLRLRSGPLQADLLDAEIVRGVDVEGHHFGVQHDLFERFAPGDDARGFVLDGMDFEHQRLARGQAVGVAPGELPVRVAADRSIAGRGFRLRRPAAAGRRVPPPRAGGWPWPRTRPPRP